MNKDNAVAIAQSRAVDQSARLAANDPKHQLIELERRLERTESPHTKRRAAQLGRIIARLEHWQNTP